VLLVVAASGEWLHRHWFVRWVLPPFVAVVMAAALNFSLPDLARFTPSRNALNDAAPAGEPVEGRVGWYEIDRAEVDGETVRLWTDSPIESSHGVLIRDGTFEAGRCATLDTRRVVCAGYWD